MQKQDDPPGLSAVTWQPLMLALRPSKDGVGMEIRGDELKNRGQMVLVVCWCFVGRDTECHTFSGAVGGRSRCFSSSF